MPRVDPVALFWSKVEKTQGCWNWKGVRKTTGYGQCWDGSAVRTAHRYAYQITIGPIPDGLVLDHLCRNIICVRPDHLEAVTQRVNLMRTDVSEASDAQKTETDARRRKLMDAALTVFLRFGFRKTSMD